ncbi:hypothetical protein ACFY5J_14055 [Peribacillus butanolivorans]|uniref:hypothetical protein n=1 Tax=Peribacillus TaxID=2675229 RepID=UPI0019132707|nr:MULTISPECIES: hypothetical protein [unclassified Peribacillus]MBK5446416.1 hypothetical protein [Peribacillus sp. TH24]MBK5480731.1 hypothetical protein [Peribacillus sp. TH16]WMX57795.1 hypothetical protein RE409_11620 [Peribacillus sp. R9-11]
MKSIIFILSIFLLIGCSDSGNKQQLEQPKSLKVLLESNPKKIKINEAVAFTAEVKYGTENVSKEAEVQFEIIENGISIGSVFPKNKGDGKYLLETKFFDQGQKKVIAHVSYKTLHEMPELSFQVSN